MNKLLITNSYRETVALKKLLVIIKSKIFNGTGIRIGKCDS